MNFGTSVAMVIVNIVQTYVHMKDKKRVNIIVRESLINMIWIILAVIAVIALVTNLIRDEYLDVAEKMLLGTLLAFVFELAAMLLALFMNVMCFVPVEEYTLESTQEIYTLKDNSYISGHGFISVRIEEEDKYTYMVVNDDGTYSKKSIESDNVRIKEVDNVTPVLEKYIITSKNQFWSVHSQTYYCFVVPKGTVVNTFNVDLE